MSAHTEDRNPSHTAPREKVAFTAERLERFDKTVAKYEKAQSALLPALYLAQEQWGFLTPAVMEYVAGLLKMPAATVFEAASFYFLFKKKDMGKYCMQVCNNITCSMMGSEKVLQIIREELGIGPNDVSSDGRFSCMAVQCLGSCDTAPVVQVNDDYFENMDPDVFREHLRKWKAGEEPKPQQVLN